MKPAVEAAAAGARGDHDRSVQLLDNIGPLEAGNPFITMSRGVALFRAGRHADAAAAFERALNNRFTAEPTVIYPVGQIWLARTKVRSGDMAAARRAYQEAFAFWKDADLDIPILAQAKQEAAQLTDSQ